MRQLRTTERQPIYEMGRPEPVGYMYNNGRWAPAEDEPESQHAQLQGLRPREVSFVNEPALRASDIVHHDAAGNVFDALTTGGQLWLDEAGYLSQQPYEVPQTTSPGYGVVISSPPATGDGVSIDIGAAAGPPAGSVNWNEIFSTMIQSQGLFRIRSGVPADIVEAVEWITEDWGDYWPEKILAITYLESTNTIVLTTTGFLFLLEQPYGYTVIQKGPDGQTHQIAGLGRGDSSLFDLVSRPYAPTISI